MLKKTLSVFIGFFALCFVVLGVGNVWAVDGTLKWAFDTGGDVEDAPTIGADGTIYAYRRRN